jgi:hypothetical protein
VNISTCHPFTVGDIIGVHNGTIKDLVPTNLSESAKATRLGSDSYNAFVYLSTHTVEETYEYLNSKGAFALVWYNTKDKTVNFLRNFQRPLHYIDSGSTMYWSSTKEDLAYVFNNNTHKIKEFNTGTHYQIKVGETPMLTSVEVAKKYSTSTFLPKICKEIVVPFDSSKKVEPSTTVKTQTTLETVLNATHQWFNKTRMINVKMIKHFKQQQCSYCTNELCTKHNMNWLLFHGTKENVNNETFLVNSVMPLCKSCSANENVLGSYKDYADLVTSVPIDISIQSTSH